MDYKFKIASQAKRDLNGIWQYHAENAGPHSADALNFRDKLLALAESLKTFPSRHGSLEQRPNIRKVPYRTYLIFYKINEETRTVEILRFWHSARDQRRLRLKEEPSPAYATSPTAVPAIAS